MNELSKRHCRFYNYQLPEDANWLGHILLPIAESFGMACYRHEKKFYFVIKHPDLPLNSQKTFLVEKPLAGKDSTTELEILRWSLHLVDGEQPEIDMLLREPKVSPVERWFAAHTSDTQMLLAALTLVLSLALIAWR